MEESIDERDPNPAEGQFAPRGLRKRWAGGMHRNAATSAVSNYSPSLAESLFVDDVPGDSARSQHESAEVPTSDLDTVAVKRFCSHSSMNAFNVALEVARKPTLKLPWQTGPLSPLFTGRFEFQPKMDIPQIPKVGIKDLSGSEEASSSVVGPGQSTIGHFAKRRIAAAKFSISDDDLRVRACRISSACYVRILGVLQWASH